MRKAALVTPATTTLCAHTNRLWLRTYAHALLSNQTSPRPDAQSGRLSGRHAYYRPPLTRTLTGNASRMITRVRTGRQSGRHVSSANLNARYRQPLPRTLTADASRMITRVRTGCQSDRHVSPSNQDA